MKARGRWRRGPGAATRRAPTLGPADGCQLEARRVVHSGAAPDSSNASRTGKGPWSSVAASASASSSVRSCRSVPAVGGTRVAGGRAEKLFVESDGQDRILTRPSGDGRLLYGRHERVDDGPVPAPPGLRDVERHPASLLQNVSRRLPDLRPRRRITTVRVLPAIRGARVVDWPIAIGDQEELQMAARYEERQLPLTRRRTS